MELNRKGSMCYWITGLSAAGKATVSREFVAELRGAGVSVILLDGDELRAVLGADAYTKDERIELGLLYGRMCKMLLDQGVNLVIAAGGLFHVIQERNRRTIPHYVEVFLDVPLEELVRRDPKGMYKKALSGEIDNVMGMDLQVEYPVSPDIHIKWEDGMTSTDISGRLLKDFCARTSVRDSRIEGPDPSTRVHDADL